MKKGKIKVYRTREGNLFEAAGAVLAVILWVLVLRDGTTVPFAVIGTAGTALCMYAAYHPDVCINVPGGMGSAAQYAMASRMSRMLGVEITLMCIAQAAWPQTEVPCALGATVIVSTAMAFTAAIRLRR